MTTPTKSYGFRAHLSAAFPSQVIMDVTEACNLQCIHCPHEAMTAEGLLNKQTHMSPEVHKKVIDEVARAGQGHCRYLRYTAQGEPMLNPHIYELLSYAVENSGVQVALTTNGTVLGGPRAAQLLDTGLDVVDISLDAFTARSYEAIRKKGDHARTQANVQNLLRARQEGGHGTRIVVSFVEQEINTGEAEAFEAHWREAGADQVVIRRLHSAGGAMKDLLATPEARYPCLYPWERLSVGADGMVHFCPQDWLRGSLIGDVRSESLADIWTGAKMDTLREAHLQNDYSCHGLCGDCPDWSTTRWPGEGRSYADMMREFRQTGDGQQSSQESDGSCA